MSQSNTQAKASVPSLRVSLATDGTLVIEMPGAQAFEGRARYLRSKSGELESHIRRILEAQLSSRHALGEDGSPTQSQVTHWERHAIWADARCPHCIAEGRAGASAKRKARPIVLAQYEGTVIRRIPAKAKPKRQLNKTTTELGL